MQPAADNVQHALFLRFQMLVGGGDLHGERISRVVKLCRHRVAHRAENALQPGVFLQDLLTLARQRCRGLCRMLAARLHQFSMGSGAQRVRRQRQC